MELWSLIVKSNTFNFTVFLLIIIAVAKSVDIGKVLDNMQQKIQTIIEDSKKAKEASIGELKAAEDSVKNLPHEVDQIIEDAMQSAEKLGERILQDAKVQAENIIVNADKSMESERRKVVSSLSERTALASVELAKSHIIKTLDKKPQYHAEFIEKSIEELDRLNF